MWALRNGVGQKTSLYGKIHTMENNNSIREEDIRAAVAAGVLTEVQAQTFQTYAHVRQGVRRNVAQDDEPFVLFSGFSEIFISIGLVLLFVGIAGYSGVYDDFVTVPYGTIAITFGLAFYFTRKRKMVLPSIVLVLVFTLSLGVAVMKGKGVGLHMELNGPALIVMSSIGATGMVVYYLTFRLPFALLLLAGFIFAVFVGIGVALDPVGWSGGGDWSDRLFDLSQSTIVGVCSLVFGIFTFAAAMYFDLKDPQRVTRYSACGFWLHIAAAPALVNTVAVTLLNQGNLSGTLLGSGWLLLMAIVAIIIDRRSLLTMGAFYMAAVLAWFFDISDVPHLPASFAIIFTLGVLVTVLGTWWMAIRQKLMCVLPTFPWKERLPPYGAI
jgi:hypothetical protein